MLNKYNRHCGKDVKLAGKKFFLLDVQLLLFLQWNIVLS
jgi:hypothetical protein